MLRQGATWAKGHSSPRGGALGGGGWLGSTLKYAAALLLCGSVVFACFTRRDAMGEALSGLFPSRSGYSVVPQDEDVASFDDDDGFN